MTPVLLARGGRPPRQAGKYRSLTARLLKLGGERVVREFEGFLDDIVERGRVFTGRPHRVRGGEGESQRNVAVEYLASRGRLQVVVGYALRDGTWSRHAWLWDGRRVVETTTPAEAYFGALLDGRGADYFTFREVCGMLQGTTNDE